MEANYFMILYWFCHTLTWIRHGCTCVPHPESSSHLPPDFIPLGHPSAPAPSTLYHASNLDWWFVSHMIIYMFQCHSPKSSHPLPLPQSPKDCFIYLCLFCSLTYNFMLKLNGWGIAFMNQQRMWFLEMKPVSDKDAINIIEITRFRIWYKLCWLMAGFENTNYSSERRFTASKMFSNIILYAKEEIHS